MTTARSMNAARRTDVSTDGEPLKPNYAGRLLDQLVIIVAQQTADYLRETPDDGIAYAEKRGGALETVTWHLWKARERLQTRRRRDEAWRRTLKEKK